MRENISLRHKKIYSFPTCYAIGGRYVLTRHAKHVVRDPLHLLPIGGVVRVECSRLGASGPVQGVPILVGHVTKPLGMAKQAPEQRALSTQFKL